MQNASAVVRTRDQIIDEQLAKHRHAINVMFSHIHEIALKVKEIDGRMDRKLLELEQRITGVENSLWIITNTQ
jgi:hypothetical protein